MSPDTAHRRRILWIKADPLHPLDSGGRIRTYNMLREWSRRHDIAYLALFPQGTPESAKRDAARYSTRQTWVPWKDQPKRGARFYLSLLRNLLASRTPYVIDKYASRAAALAIRHELETHDFDLVVSDFLSMTPNIEAAGVPPERVVVFQHNVESQIWKRHFETARNPLMKAYMYVQWRRYDRFERATCSRYAGVIAVSEDDAVRFREEFGLTNVLGHVPTGVDVEYFGEVPYTPEPDHLVFLGSMDWMPNVDGIVDFVRNAYPRIRAARPGARLTIVGRSPAPAVVALAQGDPTISVTGTVDDVRPFLARAAISIVPLRVGGGTRIKIFEAMAMGIPVVSTSIGAEGLPVHDGTDIAIADESADFAERVVRLLADPDRATAIGSRGRALVEERFSWRTVVDLFDSMCERVARAPSPASSDR